jgi:hypothetical protein
LDIHFEPTVDVINIAVQLNQIKTGILTTAGVKRLHKKDERKYDLTIQN